MDDFMTVNTGAFRHTHPFRESKTYPGLITKPDRNLREYLELDKDDEFEFTPENVNSLIMRYIRNANFDCWYVSPDCDTFTPKSYIFPLPKEYKDITYLEVESSLPPGFFPKFVRLNSVSPKYTKPVYSLKESLQHIYDSNRCKNVIELYKHYGFPNLLVFRDFKDVNQGVEYRCFLYNDKLTAICTNDTKARQSLTDEELVQRIQEICVKAQPWRPYQNIVQDVFISSETPINDFLIEYASFGSYTNTSSGAFNWMTDIYDLTNGESVTIKRSEL
jgi:hypothetical protein